MEPSEELLGLYRCARFKFDPQVATVATDLAEKDCEVRGLDMAEIGVIAAADCLPTQPALATALAACQAQLGLPPEAAQIVYCEWSWVHADVGYRDQLFVSVVLATGPEPYCVQSLQTPQTRGAQVLDTKRIVSVGDVFLLDPCVAHMAAPVTPNNQALLVLAQWSLPAATEAERAAVRARFAPLPYDRHQSSMLDL
jgi:hypothetical protein